MIKTLRKKINPSLVGSDLINMHLSIQIRLDGLSFLIFAPKSKQYQVSFDYEISSSNNTPENLLTGIDQIFNRNFYLQNKYKKITVLYQNPFYTVVPNNFFDESHLSSYLDQHVKVFNNDVFYHDDIESLNAKGVYLSYSNINNYLIKKVGEFDFYHQNSVLCKELISKHTYNKTPVLHLNFLNNSLTVIVIQEKSLKLINQYECSNDVDVVYYCLFVIEQLKLNINQLDIEVSGDFNSEHPYYETVTRYFSPLKTVKTDRKSKDLFIEEDFASYYPLITLEG